MLSVVAANISGKSYDSKTGCGWKVGGGSNRRVRCGTGGSAVGDSGHGGEGVDNIIPSDNGQAPP